jgi:hypothetical protein
MNPSRVVLVAALFYLTAAGQSPLRDQLEIRIEKFANTELAFVCFGDESAAAVFCSGAILYGFLVSRIFCFRAQPWKLPPTELCIRIDPGSAWASLWANTVSSPTARRPADG